MVVKKKCIRCETEDRAKGAYKYCEKCKRIISLKTNRERLRKIREDKAEANNQKCERCETEPRWSSSLTTKYCYRCKMIVQNEQIKLKNKEAKVKRGKKVKRNHKKMERKTTPRAENAKAINKDLYAEHHVGPLSKKKISEFRYSSLLADCIVAEKKSYNRNKKYKANDQLSGSDKLAKRKAVIQIDKLIVLLLKGSDTDRVHGRLLKLEKEYACAYEKQLLILMIEESTKMPVGGSYTLAEAGDILGVTRERARQIENGATKVLNHPLVARQLKDMNYE